MKKSPTVLAIEYESRFPEDDYDDVNEEFFADLRSTRDISSDLSGWLDTYSRVQERFPALWPEPPSLQTYRVDDGGALKREKEPIRALLSAWETHEVDFHAFTLCGSATTGSLIALVVLAGLGIKTVVFETPAYYATLDQARRLGLSTLRVPTYADNDFRFEFTRSHLGQDPIAVWITQPRVSLGLDQSPRGCEEILRTLRPDDYLVVDEATEQHFPSVLREVANDPRVLRIRNLFKPMGLNGPRLCTVLHPTSLRNAMEFATVSFGGPLDCFSLELGAKSAQDIAAFRTHLSVANNQTTQARIEAERLLLGSGATVTRLVNGYIGCAVLNLAHSFRSPAERRREFLEYCRAKRMPVILGSQMSFATDPRREFVRINYFTHWNRLRMGVLLIRDFMRSEQLAQDSAKLL